MDTNLINSSFEEVRQMFKETALRFKETDLKFRESEARFKKMEDIFIDKWGRFMEVLINSGALQALKEYQGLNVTSSASRVREDMRNGFGRGMEIDVLCWGKDVVVPIEVKTTLNVEYVKEHEERLKRFSQCFPRFAGSDIYGGVAALHFNEDSDRYAYRKGLYVMTLVGKSMVSIINDQKFKPAVW